MVQIFALSLWAVVGVHESALSPLTGPEYTRGYVRGIDGVAVDPASVAGVDGYALQYRHRIVREEGGLGRLGAFGALPFSRLVLFGGYEWFLIPNANFERGTLGLAAVINPRLWAGISFGGLSSPHPELRGMVWNFSLYSELFSWLTLSAGVDGFNQPQLLGREILPDFVFGASVRPIIGEPWLTLGSEVRIAGGGRGSYNAYFNRAVVDVSPWEGIHVNAAYGRTVNDLPVGSRLTVADAHELWFGLSLALGGLEARVSTRALQEPGSAAPLASGDPVFADNQVALTVRFRPSESVIHTGGRTVQVPLFDELEDPKGILDPGSPIASVLYHLDRLADDDTVATVLLPIGKLEVGMATVDELRSAIRRLRDTGKTVVAHLSTATDKTYLVAAACNVIRMDPAATLAVDGFAVTLRYYADALAKVGVSVESVNIGKYKTGPDPFTRNAPRPEDIEVQEQIVGQAYSTLIQALMHDRGLSEVSATQVLDTALYTASAAKEAGLIDDFTVSTDASGVPLYYPGGEALDPEPRPSRRWSQRPIVRVIPIVGTIVARPDDNILPGASAAAVDIVPAIEEAASDGDVDAVVLRIDSPGGDVLASDIIWRAVRRLRELKPVVVSMGDVAASGGYYVAAPAHKIFAEPNTVTGSIGIFVMRAQLSGLFDMLDIGSHTVKRGPHADMEVWERPLTDDDRERVERNLRAYYDTFVGKVAEGRRMQVPQVHKIAQGRVYTGAAAHDLGLVDELGGLAAAVREAKRLAGFDPDDDVEVQLPKHRRSFSRLVMQLTGLASAESGSLVSMLGHYSEQLRSWDGRPLALLPVSYELDH